MPSVRDVLRVLSDEKAFVIFKSIANEDENRSEMIKTKFKLTQKQYYTRMAYLTRNGLIRKDKGRYLLTAFGRVVHHAQSLVETAIKNYWKLRAIDSVLNSMEAKLPKNERQNIVDSLIDSKEIKELLVARNHNAYSSEANQKYTSG